MDRRNRRHVFTTCVIGALVVASLASLGVWQLQRREWKQDLIAQRRAVWTAPPIDLNEALAAQVPLDSLLGRRATLKGQFIGGDTTRFSTLFLLGQSYHGRPGVHAITPFHLENSNGVILIDRGWLPIDASFDDGWLREDPLPYPPGQGFLTGIIKPSEKLSSFTPDNDAGKGQWYWVDIATMARHLGLSDGMAPIYLELTEPAPDSATHAVDIPLPAVASPDEIPNNHLQYALTWFALALITGGMTLLYLRKFRRS